MFRAYVAALAVLTLFGLTRVSLSARVAESSVDLGRLRSDIRSERLVSDQLEVDRGVLMTPSRLEDIASASMRMEAPAEVTYIALGTDAGAPAAGRTGSGAEAVAEDAPDGEDDAFRRALAAFMDMAAGEAQVLLVGDVGLASAR